MKNIFKLANWVQAKTQTREHREDKLTKIAIALKNATNNFSLWNETLSDNAVVKINNTVMDGKTVKGIWKSHHTIFNNIQINDSYAHTNYFKGGNYLDKSLV